MLTNVQLIFVAIVEFVITVVIALLFAIPAYALWSWIGVSLLHFQAIKFSRLFAFCLWSVFIYGVGKASGEAEFIEVVGEVEDEQGED